MSQENYKNKYLRYKSKYLDLKYGGDDIYLKKQRIANFIRVLFASIGRPPSLCFFEGSLVIQDNDNSLYNLLRYGEVENVQNTDLNQRHITSDFMEVFKRNSRVKMEFYNSKNEHEQVLCKDKCLKFELIFNKPLENLCERHTSIKRIIDNKYDYLHVIEDMYKQPKESILFYKFVYNNNKYLFLKLLPSNYEEMRQIQEMQQMQEMQEMQEIQGGNRKKQAARKKRELQELQDQLEKERQGRQGQQQREQELQELQDQLEKERQERQQREEEIKDKLERVKKIDEENERKQKLKEQDERSNQGRREDRILKEQREEEKKDQEKMSKFYIRDETDFPDYIENPENNLKIKDNWFYHHLYGNDKEEMKKINYYNDHLRTGKEFFIPEKLKNEIIKFSKSEAETKKYVSFYNDKKINDKDLVDLAQIGLQNNTEIDWYPTNKEDEQKRLEKKRFFPHLF